MAIPALVRAAWHHLISSITRPARGHAAQRVRICREGTFPACRFGSIGALGGQTGQRLVKKLLMQTGRPSIVVLILGSIIGLAVVIMTTMGIVGGVQDSQKGEDIWTVDTSHFVCDRD